MPMPPELPEPPDCAYEPRAAHHFAATEYTRGPWNPQHQHAGPPTALVCRAIELAAAAQGLTHLGRLTVNLLRPVPLGELHVEVTPDYVGRNAGHYSARLLDAGAGGKELARVTALMQREDDNVPVPEGTPAHPLPGPPPLPAACPRVYMPFVGKAIGYGDFVENRLAAGTFFRGPCTAWFRMQHPLVAGEVPSPYQRVAVAADSGNGVSAALAFESHVFVNCDLTIHLLRRPIGEWICLEARTALGGNGCGLAESVLYDEHGLIGRAVQSLAVRRREAA